MLASKRPDVRCRLIEEADIDSVVDCLRRGFPYRLRTYWARAMERMSTRPAIDDFPRYGYLLEVAGDVVGVILLIYSRQEEAAGSSGVRCNLSSWCVDKKYRGYALVLHATAVKRKDVTYVNVSPAPHTRRAIEVGQFKRFCEGQIVFAPILSASRRNVRVTTFAMEAPESALLSQGEREILAEHARLGCRALVCVKDDAAYPFVFQRRAAFHRLVPCQQLIYCRAMDEFVQFAGPIGRYLLLRTWPVFLADANGPVKGLVGKYFADYGPKYFKGPAPPRLGDLSYTELVILGP
jgi:hypothetical protein